MRQNNVKSFVKLQFYLEEDTETERIRLNLCNVVYGSVQGLLDTDDVVLGAVQGRSKIVHKGGGGWRRSALGSGAPLDVYIK